MTKEDFEKIKPELQKSFEEAIRSAAKKCPEGFLSWLGMKVTPTTIARIRDM